MQSERFDLNDILHEPTDEQLESLMQSVALEARRRSDEARAVLMLRLHQDIAAANLKQAVT